jgi:alpha-ketoglutaric semialdehyde dehydrogenase
MNRDFLVPLVSTPFRHYINGGWETGATTGLALNPSDLDEPIGEYMRADISQTNDAIEAASAAFRDWSQVAAQRRADALDAVAGEMLARRDELSRLLAREVGKTLPEALLEVTRAGQMFRWFAAQAVHISPETFAPAQAGVDVEIARAPLGVVGIIAPWSAPLAIPAAQIAAALAFGNCVVFKPAETVPACASALASIISRAKLPIGAFNLVMGSGRQVGARIATHPLVAALSFSGSAENGRQVLRAALAREARVQLNTSGPNALVVLNDAALENAVEAALVGAFGAAGQRGSASARLIVERGVLEPFVDALTAKLAALHVDHALKRSAALGPVANAEQLERALHYLRVGREEGAQLVHGGNQLERATRGYYLAPALFRAEPGHRIAREHLFGPLAVVLAADDYEHALYLANNVPSAVCAGIFTGSLGHARHFRRAAQCGAVTINLPTTAADHYTPTGARQSWHYETNDTAFWTTLKAAYVAG